jgi:hypothetical protein
MLLGAMDELEMARTAYGERFQYYMYVPKKESD